MKTAWVRLLSWRRGQPTGAEVEGPSLNVLMVCTGNICRSPTAHAVLLAKLRAAGLHKRVLVESAGTHGFHVNEPPDVRAQRHAARRGYDLSRLRARHVEDEDFERFDWILAMDEKNLEWLRSQAPASPRARIGLLMEHARKHPSLLEVPDPYYGAADGFERVLELVEDACDGLVAQWLAAEPGAGTS